MPQHHHWSRLNHLQVGRYAEYFFKMQFVLLGFDVYSSEVDDRGIDFVLRRHPDRYWDVQVKSIRKTGYVFFPKATPDYFIRPTLLIALALFNDGHEPDLFLIPAIRWRDPEDTLNGVLVDRDYEGLRSRPEYGINLSKKGIGALDPFRFHSTLETVFGGELSGVER